MSEYKQLLIQIEELDEEVMNLNRDLSEITEWYEHEKRKNATLQEEIARLAILVRQAEIREEEIRVTVRDWDFEDQARFAGG